MQAVASAGGGGASLQQHHGGMQHHTMNHAIMSTGTPTAQVNTNNYEANSGGHYYNEVRRGQEDVDMPDSPTYMGQRGYEHDQYGETSASGSNSCDEEDDRDFDGKRSGDPLSGLAAKKRRKQSKPIRLGSEEDGENPEDGEAETEAEGEAEEGEIARYRRVSGDSVDGGVSHDSPPSQSDAPLNLSSVSKHSDNDKSESGGLRVLGRELMQSPEKEGFKQQSSEASSMFPGSNFGMPGFMFPFSGIGPLPTSSSLSMSRADLEQGFTPSSSSGGQIQIFNIEAYCKLCNKEFCNKYFLKTHMANKHGIYSDPATSTSSAGPRFEGGSLSSSLYDRSPLRLHGSSVPVSISGSFMTMSSPKSSSALLPQQRESPKDSIDGPQSRPQSNSDMRSPLPSPIRPQSTGAGGGPAERSTPTGGSPKSGPPPLIPGRPNSVQGSRLEDAGSDKEMSLEDMKRMDKELLRQGLDMTSLPSGIRLPMVPSMSPFGGPMHFDNLLKMNPLSPMDAIRKEADLEAEFDKSKGRTIPNVPSLPKGTDGSGQKGNMTPDRLRQMGVINADAFCEYCCKEFCNKYFLRVHKLKKHGVCSPELPPEKVQKILQQMAKEAGKTGQPMPPLTMGAPSAVRPPGTPGSLASEPPRSLNGSMGPMGSPFGSMGALGSMGGPLNLIRPPHLPNFLNLPPIDAVPTSREDSHSSCSSERPDEREEGRPINFSSSPRSIIEPECELKIDENAPVIKSPLTKDPEDHLESSEDQELKSSRNISSTDREQVDKSQGEEPSEGLANLQNMIMKLNNTKNKQMSDSTTICKICNKDMENKYFLHAHMMNEHGMLHVEDGSKSPIPVTLPQYPADLSKMAEKNFGQSQGLTIPNPMLSRTGQSLHSLANGFPKLSDKPMNIFEQMQGLPRPSFLEQMKKDLGAGSGIDIPLSPMKRPSLDRDPNKKPASLSRSYCEICKKELCNKYFMKTHMMKMHGIMMEDGPPKGSVPCDICKKELSSRYFLKVHMAHEHGLNEDGTPIPPHLRENGLLNMFPMPGEFPPPPLGEFSRLLMQQGEKNMERQKELERQRESNGGAGGHVCSLCSNTFPDIIALQVHIIKSHGALPPTTGLDGLFNKNDEEKDEDRDRNNEKDDIAEEEGKDKEEEENDGDVLPVPAPTSMFPFPMGMPMQEGEASKNLQELLQRQLQFPGMMNPLMGFPGLAGAGAGGPNQQFQGLFNMFLSEMLKKVQKDTPPQTPPSSPPASEDPCVEETSS